MKKNWILILIVAGVAVFGWVLFRRGAAEGAEIEYRYSPVVKTDLTRSISANGQLVALTTVDIKSKAGGKIVKLAVQEGDAVKAGDLIAEIDPSDTQATYDQAKADLDAAQARARQAETNYEMQTAAFLCLERLRIIVGRGCLFRTSVQKKTHQKDGGAEKVSHNRLLLLI